MTEYFPSLGWHHNVYFYGNKEITVETLAFLDKQGSGKTVFTSLWGSHLLTVYISAVGGGMSSALAVSYIRGQLEMWIDLVATKKVNDPLKLLNRCIHRFRKIIDQKEIPGMVIEIMLFLTSSSTEKSNVLALGGEPIFTFHKDKGLKKHDLPRNPPLGIPGLDIMGREWQWGAITLSPGESLFLMNDPFQPFNYRKMT